MNKATEELLKQLEPIHIKVYEMGIYSKGKQSVRTNTLVWAGEATTKLLKDMGYKRVVDRELPEFPGSAGRLPYSSYKEAQRDMLKWHNASLEEIDIE